MTKVNRIKDLSEIITARPDSYRLAKALEESWQYSNQEEPYSDENTTLPRRDYYKDREAYLYGVTPYLIHY